MKICNNQNNFFYYYFPVLYTVYVYGVVFGGVRDIVIKSFYSNDSLIVLSF